MNVKIVKGMRILYPDDENNILRSRITGNKFEFVFLSRDESETDYVEEKDIDNEDIDVMELLEIKRRCKLNDLDARYDSLRKKILKAYSIDQLNNINIF